MLERFAGMVPPPVVPALSLRTVDIAVTVTDTVAVDVQLDFSDENSAIQPAGIAKQFQQQMLEILPLLKKSISPNGKAN